jgi:hypothetical protein
LRMIKQVKVYLPNSRPGEEERVKNVLENAGANIEINTKARVTDKDLEKYKT